jgi:hypothetical protein
MVAWLHPDLVVVNAASTQTVETVIAMRDAGTIPGTAIGFTNEQDTQFVDNLVGGRVSTTAIIRRAQQLSYKPTSTTSGLL